MNDLLKSDHIRKAIRDPIVAKWILRILKNTRESSAPDVADLERSIFDDVTIRRVLDAGDHDVLTDMFASLPSDLFQNAADVLVERWPTWRDTVACWSAPVIAESAPQGALRLFRAHISSPHLWDDFNKTAGVARALRLMRSEAGRELAKLMIDRMANATENLDRRFSIGESLQLAWVHQLPVIEDLLIDLITAPDKVDVAEQSLAGIYHIFTEGMPFFEHVTDLRQDQTKQSFASLTLFFDQGAPLDELDRLVTGVDEISIGDALVFASIRCSSREYRLRDVVCACMANRKKAVESKLEPVVGQFLLAVAAASWLNFEQDYAERSAEDCVSAIASDLRRLPGYDSLLARLKQFQPNEVLQPVRARLPEVQDHFGGVHLARLMGDLRYDAFVPLLIGCLDAGMRDFLVDASAEALSQFGPRAEQAVIESWGRLDRSQKARGLDVLAHVGDEATVVHLVRCFPEMRNEFLDTWCNAAEAVPDTRLLNVLEAELRRMHPVIDETFLLLSTLLGKDHAELAAVRKRVHDRTRKTVALRAGRELNADVGALSMELKCRICGDQNVYNVRSVYLNPEQPGDDPYIADELTCPSCGAVDDLEMTGPAHMSLMAEMMRLTVSSESGGALEGPLKLVTGKLRDGRLLSVGHAIRHYEEAVKKEPDSLVDTLSLGNCYATVNRARQAEACFRACLRIDSSCPEAALSLAEILDETGRRKEAFQVLERAWKHKDRWRFHRLTDATPKEFTEAYAELYSAVAPVGSMASRAALDWTRFDTHRKADTPEKTQPNAPCPCGSGKKYKKCCGRIA